MDRRFFIFAAALTLPALAAPPAAGWKANVHYVLLPSAERATTAAEHIEVLEAFSYTCIHCYHFEPHILQWRDRSPPYITFARIPSQWDDRHSAHARLYRTLEILGRNDLDQDAFDAIHRDKNPLFSADRDSTKAIQAEFAGKHGIAKQDFLKVYESAAVDSLLRQDAQLLDSFQITETPAMVINRRYMTDASHVSGAATSVAETAAFDDLIALTDELVAREARRLQAPGRTIGS